MHGYTRNRGCRLGGLTVISVGTLADPVFRQSARPLVLALLVVAVVVGAYALSLGTVYGTVKGVPCFFVPPDVCQKPMAGVTIRFQAEIAGVNSTATTRADGTFTVRLPPGKYRIDVFPFGGGRVLEGPREFTLWPVENRRIDLLIPSGLL